MPDVNCDYYRRREAQERALAARCADVSARRRHQELADRYALLVDMMAPEPPPVQAA